MWFNGGGIDGKLTLSVVAHQRHGQQATGRSENAFAQMIR